MKYYAGLDLCQLDMDDLNAQKAQIIKEAFYAHNSHISNYKNLSSRSEHVITHLSNYFKLTLSGSLSATQELAFTLKFLPAECATATTGNKYLYVKLLQQALKDEDYKKMDLDERMSLIKKHKKVLNIAYNWEDSVQRYSEATIQQNLCVAYGFLKQIENMDKNLSPKATNKYMSLILSMQIINYLDVLIYMRRILLGGAYAFATPELITLYEQVDLALQETVNKLIALPEEEPRKSALARMEGMLFACVPKKAPIKNLTNKQHDMLSKHFVYTS